MVPVSHLFVKEVRSFSLSYSKVYSLIVCGMKVYLNYIYTGQTRMEQFHISFYSATRTQYMKVVEM